MLKPTNAIVAVSAKKAPHFTGVVAVVYMQVMARFRFFHWLKAYSAYPALGPEHFIVLLKRYAVSFFQIGSALYKFALRPLAISPSYLAGFFRVFRPPFPLYASVAFSAVPVLDLAFSVPGAPRSKRPFFLALGATSHKYFHLGTMPQGASGGNS